MSAPHVGLKILAAFWFLFPLYSVYPLKLVNRASGASGANMCRVPLEAIRTAPQCHGWNNADCFEFSPYVFNRPKAKAVTFC